MGKETIRETGETKFSIKPPRGTHDIVPPESQLWQNIESIASDIMRRACYQEIRIPIFEHTELFKRGVGETTDIVNKEMYTFNDKSERSLTLRPEGTAGVVRAYLNGGMHRLSPPVKLWYIGPMFRYEGTQTGRQRQFHQIGLEAFGSAGPLIDAEAVVIAWELVSGLGIAADCELQLNSIGCPKCRPAYRQLLKESLAPHLTSLCADCQDRFERNPLRMLDCKSRHCQEHYQNVPYSVDNLCSDCEEHWQGLLTLVSKQGVGFVVNKRLVRGLDYYTRTVMEIVTHDPRLQAQSTILAGGRYDNLVETFGGPPTPAVGWASGMERLKILIDKELQAKPQVFVIADQAEIALHLCTELRAAGIICDLDFPAQGVKNRNFGKQLQQANKSQASWAILAGDDELKNNEATVKDMSDGSQTRIPLGDLANHILKCESEKRTK